MEENILSRFGWAIKSWQCPGIQIAKFSIFYQKFNIVIGHSTTYYPQGNGVAYSSNKAMVRMLKKTIIENQINYDSQLKFSF